MNALATIPDTNDAKPARKPRISPRVVHAVELLVSGECRTIKAAAEKANLSREGLSKALSKVHVASYLEQQTRVTLARLQAPAVGTLAKLLAEASSEHVQNDVAKHVLAIAGHKPKADAQVSVNIDIKAGYVIDLTDEPKLVESSAQRIAGQMAKTQVIDNAE
jgi:hypothetical protein